MASVRSLRGWHQVGAWQNNDVTFGLFGGCETKRNPVLVSAGRRYVWDVPDARRGRFLVLGVYSVVSNPRQPGGLGGQKSVPEHLVFPCPSLRSCLDYSFCLGDPGGFVPVVALRGLLLQPGNTTDPPDNQRE